MASKRLCSTVAVILSGFFVWAGPAWGSDSIVGWTTSETVISDGTTTLSTGTIQPIYSAPGIGKYIIIDGKRYVEMGSNRFALPRGGSSSESEASSDGPYHHRSHKHHHHHKHPEEDWKKIDAERNASMTPSQKIYRDLKKKTYPELFDK